MHELARDLPYIASHRIRPHTYNPDLSFLPSWEGEWLDDRRTVVLLLDSVSHKRTCSSSMHYASSCSLHSPSQAIILLICRCIRTRRYVCTYLEFKIYDVRFAICDYWRPEHTNDEDWKKNAGLTFPAQAASHQPQ